MGKRLAASALLLWCVIGSERTAVAHGGGLNAAGCHNNRKTGDYHCHRNQGGDGDSGASGPARPPPSPPPPPAPRPAAAPRATAALRPTATQAATPAPEPAVERPADDARKAGLRSPERSTPAPPPSKDPGSGGGFVFFVLAGFGAAGFFAWRSLRKHARQPTHAHGHWPAPIAADAAVLLARDLAALLRSVATADRRLSVEERDAFHSLFAQFFWNRPDIAQQALWYLDNAVTSPHEVAAALGRARTLDPGVRSQLMSLSMQLAHADQKLTPKEQERLAALGAALA